MTETRRCACALATALADCRVGAGVTLTFERTLYRKCCTQTLSRHCGMTTIDENVFRDEIEVVHTSDELVDGVTSVPVASGGRVQPRGT